MSVVEPKTSESPSSSWARIRGWLTGKSGALPRDPSNAEWQLVQSIEDLGPRYQNITDQELADESTWLRKQIAIERGEIGDEFTRTAFALANEALYRVRGFRYYPVQLLAGILLSRGFIAEMQTGEGKTLTATLPSFLLGLRGEGVHVATVNAYLAERDCEENRPILELLGLSVGMITDDAEPEEKREAYACDVTYGTGYIFGFDYLRDQLTLRDRLTERGRHRFRQSLRGAANASRTMQRGLAIALVDEADSVLIDDAATPLILAGGGDEEAPDIAAHKAARQLALTLVEDQHYTLDKLQNSIKITDVGHDFIHADDVEIPSLVLIRPWADYVETALRAEHLFRRDVHYIVKDDEVQLVDQTTGRIHTERQWNGGLHQAVQTLEGVAVKAESETIARVTRQRFYQLYRGVSGMTGTAAGGEPELNEMYNLSVVRVPTNRPNLRVIEPEAAFANSDAKWVAIADEVQRQVAADRPVLVGTRTIAASEVVGELLTARGVEFRLLNGKQDGEEADIISEAGRCGVVTIATNMAGRGTDIRLTPAAKAAGGLYVVATEHHESTRIDRQLVGRAARQGDPGSAKFFAAADDHLIQQYDQDLAARMIRAADASGSIPRDCASELERLQQRVEQYHFQRRREMYEQDRVQNEILKLGKQNL